MPKAIIFDIDGTLLDSVDQHASAWQEILRRYGHEVAFADVRRQIGKGGDQLLPAFLSEDEVRRVGEQVKEERSRYFKETFLATLRPFPKVRELCERLRGDGLRLVLASSAKADELKEYVRIAGIEDLIESGTSSEDAEKSKPHPDIFLAALERAGLSAADAVAVGDTPYDAEAAGKAGLRTVGVLCGGFPEDDLRKAGCVAIYEGPADLLANYERSPLRA